MNHIHLQLLGISAILFGIVLILALPGSPAIGVIIAVLGMTFSLAGASGRKEEITNEGNVYSHGLSGDSLLQ